MGGTGAAGGGRYAVGFGSQGNTVGGVQAEAGRELGGVGRRTQWRGRVYGNEIPTRVLPGVPPVSGLLPAAGVDDLQADDGTGSCCGLEAAVRGERAFRRGCAPGLKKRE